MEIRDISAVDVSSSLPIASFKFSLDTVIDTVSFLLVLVSL